MKIATLTIVAAAAAALVSSSAYAERVSNAEFIRGTIATQNEIRQSSGISSSNGLEATLFDAGGFEGYANANLSGQNGWAVDFGTTTYTVGATTGVGGTKGVTTSAGVATNWAYPVLNYTPAANEVVSVSVDIAASDPALSATDNFGFLLDCYSNAARIGRVGLVNSANTILPAVTFNNAGTVATYLLGSTPLTPGAFYNFELRFNFATKTFDIYSNNSLVTASLGFATLTPASSTAFGDGDLQISGAAGAANTGAFDNYIVSTIAIPEPATLSVLAGVGLLALRRRSK